MISDKDLLFVVDGDYLFREMQKYFGREKRVSYIRLKERLKLDRPEDLCYHMHVWLTVKDKPYTHAQLGFVSRLSMMGFEVHISVLGYDPQIGPKAYKSFAPDIIRSVVDFRCRGASPKTLVLVSGSGEYADMYTALAYLGVSIEVWYVGDGVNPKIQDVDKFLSLGKEVLFVP